MRTLLIGLVLTTTAFASDTKVHTARVNETVHGGSDFVSLNEKHLDLLHKKARSEAKYKCEKSEGRTCEEVSTKIKSLNFRAYSAWYPKVDVTIESSFSVKD